MLLLHISDIHFRSPDCQDPATDPEQSLRTAMIRDARIRCQTLGTVDAIVVGGDIAFKADRLEYEAAMRWLKELAGATGCAVERIFVVPGNHDVDRAFAGRTLAVRNVQAAIARSSDMDRARELRVQFRDPAAGHSLMAPLEAYNDFAKVFNCQIYSPDRLFWMQNLPLEQNVTLRIHGLTSTILSGMHGQDDAKGTLYLSPLQTVLNPVDDVVNMVLCHHPPEWFRDHDDVDDQICGRAAIHLFGHKHRQRIQKDANYVRFGAAAVNPDRNEGNWQPGYNLINIGVSGVGPERTLAVHAHLLQWQVNPDQFVPKMEGASSVYSHYIPIPGFAAAQPIPNNSLFSVAAHPSPKAERPAEPTTNVVSEISREGEAAMGDETTRNLVFRFWSLRSSQRRELALSMGLIEKSELPLPEPERYGRALMRAGERKQLDQLGAEIAKLERQ